MEFYVYLCMVTLLQVSNTNTPFRTVYLNVVPECPGAVEEL